MSSVPGPQPVFRDHTTRPVHNWTRARLDETQLNKGPSGPLNSPQHPCAGRNSRPLSDPAAPLSTLPHTQPRPEDATRRPSPPGRLWPAPNSHWGLAHSDTWGQLLIHKPLLPSWIRSSLRAKTSASFAAPHPPPQGLGVWEQRALRAAPQPPRTPPPLGSQDTGT